MQQQPQIWKYRLEVKDFQTIEMPQGAHVLSCQLQESTDGIGAESVCLWAIVNPEAPLITKEFMIVGTGHPIESKAAARFLGTVQENGFAWHVFEIPKVKSALEI